MIRKGNYSVPKLGTRLVALALILSSAPVYSDEQVVTYIEANGRLIELTDSWFPGRSVQGAMMAVDAKDIATTENYDRLDNSDLAVRPWVRDGDHIIIYYPENGTSRRFKSSDVKSILVDRPWTNERTEESPSQPDPA